MKLLLWCNADADTKHDVIVMLVIHGTLYLITLIAFAWLLPISLWRDWLGALPFPVVLFAEISSFLKNNLLPVCVLSALLLPKLDALVYLKLRHRWGRGAASAWFLIVFLALSAGIIFFVFGITVTLRE